MTRPTLLLWVLVWSLGGLVCGCGEAGDDPAFGGACAESFCAAPLETCRQVPDCAPLLRCLEFCSPSETSCRQGCLSRFPDGLASAEALADCLSRHCEQP